jgi:hypothetical protein
LACEAEDEDGPSGVNCPPGTYDDGEGQCVGSDDSGLCPNGYRFDPSDQCCTAEPGIPYPGCDPIGEYLTHLNTCEQGSPPLGDSCGVISVPLASCRQPGGGGEPGDGNPCTGLDRAACADLQSTCYWHLDQNQCVPRVLQ